jgi:hypothetical protein
MYRELGGAAGMIPRMACAGPRGWLVVGGYLVSMRARSIRVAQYQQGHLPRAVGQRVTALQDLTERGVKRQVS